MRMISGLMMATISVMVLSVVGSVHGEDTLPRTSDSIDYNAGICWDYNLAYYLKAAKGWRMDDSVAAANGWSAAFYPESLTAATSPIIVFPVAYFKDDTNMTVYDVIAAYGEKFESDHGGSVISDQPSITAAAGSVAEVRRFANAAAKDYQMIAFYNVPNGVIALILASRSEQDFDRSVAAFRETAGTYIFVTDKTQVRNNTDTGKGN